MLKKIMEQLFQLELRKLNKKIILFFLLFFFSYSYDLYRDINYKNLLKTSHFNIYWSDDYPQNDLWLNKVNNYPKYILELNKTLNNLYFLYLENNISLPSKINVYILNSGLVLTNPFLDVNDISSLGAFTSDELPEILINSNITGVFTPFGFEDFRTRIRSVLAHELMHAHQYNIGLIKKESKESDYLWFIEGMAVFAQLYFSSDKIYFNFLKNYLGDNINKGFLYHDYYLNYSTGIFFKYLYRRYGVSFNLLEKLFLNSKKEIDFFNKLSLDINKNIYELFSDFYNDLNLTSKIEKKGICYFSGAVLVPKKSIVKIGNNFFINKEKSFISYKGRYIIKSASHIYKINIKKGWHLYAYPFLINQTFVSNLKSKYIIWQFFNNNWDCITYDSALNKVCSKYFGIVKEIKPSSGFWIFSNKDYNFSYEVNISDYRDFNDNIKHWELKGNILNEDIEIDNELLVWIYRKKWISNLNNKNLKIKPLEGFWRKGYK